jgi:hypothetical protein
MKYSNLLGVFFCGALAVACFNPWIYIVSQNITVTGMNGTLPAFGKPGLMHLVFALMSALCFLIPAAWAKKANIFICAINLGWSIRNLVIIPACSYGECPERRNWMLIALSASILMLIFTFLPDIKIKDEDDF